MTDIKSTYASFAEAFLDEERGGRFKAVNQTTMVGADAIPKYPAGPFRDDPVGQELPLGYSVEEHEPVGTEKEIQASIEKLGAADVSPGAPDSGGAVAGPASGLLLLTDAVDPAAPPTPTTDNSDVD
jgi:hypothetical protein